MPTIPVSMQQYLKGLNYDPFTGISGLYVTRHHKRGYRYFCNYGSESERKRRKKKIFDLLNEYGQPEVPGEWDWHHIVEKEQLKVLYTPSELSVRYEQQWPVTLVHAATEHHILNSFFRSEGTRLGLETKSKGVLAGSERKDYLRALYRKYYNIYTGDPVLRTVALNVISEMR